jgi:hypothetical protein
MSFDALTIGGLLIALLSGGFLVGVVSHNDRASANRFSKDGGPAAPATVPDS